MEKLVTVKWVAETISEMTPPTGMKTKIIAIDGCGGAGKSTLAASISAELNHCSVIHTDDFSSWDNPLNWYPRMIDQVFEPLRMNRTANFQKFDWNERKLTDWLAVEPCDFVIVEGVSSSRREFRPYISFSIFVKASADIRLLRGIERDGAGAKDQWLKWMIEEEAYIKRDEPEGFADLIVDGEASIGNLIAILK